MREYFGKDVEEIDVVRNQLKLDMCNEIEKRLLRTIRRGDFLLVKAETLQCLELEFLDLVYEATKQSQIGNDTLEKINTLRRILVLFREKGDALFDEVDILLNVLQEVNFPVGIDEHIEPSRIDLIREIYSAMVSEKIPINAENAVDLKEIIGLESNKQTLLSKEDLHGVVAQAVANHLATKYEPLNLKNHPRLHGSFYRYISGKMDLICQQYHVKGAQQEEFDALTDEQKADIDFLNFLRDSRESSDKAVREGAHLAALTKHMFQSVFLTTFQKKGNQHYGNGGTEIGRKTSFLSCGYSIREFVWLSLGSDCLSLSNRSTGRYQRKTAQGYCSALQGPG